MNPTPSNFVSQTILKVAAMAVFQGVFNGSIQSLGNPDASIRIPLKIASQSGDGFQGSSPTIVLFPCYFETLLWFSHVEIQLRQ